MKAEELRKKALEICQREGWSGAAFAARAEIAESTAQLYLAGEGRVVSGPRVQEAVRRLIAGYERGEIGRMEPANLVAIDARQRPQRRITPRERRHYATRTLKNVGIAIDTAVENASIALIVAPAGRGKTEGVTAWRRERREIEHICFEFDYTTERAKVNFLMALAEDLGVEGAFNQYSAPKIFRDIVNRLLEQPAVLIFDQAEFCHTDILQLIRQIWDKTRHAGVAVVLLGTPTLLNRLHNSRAGDLETLTSRIGLVAVLEPFTREEMAFILKDRGIADVSDEAFDLWFNALRGSMRWLVESVDLLASKHKGKAVSERTVSGVLRHLIGPAVPVAAAGRGTKAAEDLEAAAGVG